MTPVFADDWLTVYQGDCRDVLATLLADSVDCVVTSPPYWQQRSYIDPDSPAKAYEIGLERTFIEWLDTIVGVCEQLRRVLKPSGSMWIVLGDRYVAHGGENSFGDRATSTAFRHKVPTWRVSPTAFPTGLKRKSLLLAPYRLAIALEELGWVLRDRIVWWKTNGIAESVGDRFHLRDEVLFRFTPERFAYFNAAAVREPYSAATLKRQAPGQADTFGGSKGQPPGRTPRSRKIWTGDEGDAHLAEWHRKGRVRADGKNPGNVWPVATASRPGNRFEHFAMFPADLIRRPMLATCPPGGVVLDPFAGTGTVAEAANGLLRRSILIELDERALDMIQVRHQRSKPVAQLRPAV